MSCFGHGPSPTIAMMAHCLAVEGGRQRARQRLKARLNTQGHSDVTPSTSQELPGAHASRGRKGWRDQRRSRERHFPTYREQWPKPEAHNCPHLTRTFSCSLDAPRSLITHSTRTSCASSSWITSSRRSRTSVLICEWKVGLMLLGVEVEWGMWNWGPDDRVRVEKQGYPGRTGR